MIPFVSSLRDQADRIENQIQELVDREVEEAVEKERTRKSLTATNPAEWSLSAPDKGPQYEHISADGTVSVLLSSKNRNSIEFYQQVRTALNLAYIAADKQYIDTLMNRLEQQI